MHKAAGYIALLIVIVAGVQGTWAPAEGGGTNGVVYVDRDATGANNGLSWDSAFTSLQSGLAAADSGDEVWVANGTYVPTTTSNRGVSFVMKNNVAVYGGFSGGETTFFERRLDEASLPTLNGNIGTRLSDDNTFHVVRFPDGVTATLDGFRIVGGNTTGDPDDLNGAGINVQGSATLRHLVVYANTTESHGAGLWVFDGFATVSDVEFRSNTGSTVMAWNSTANLDAVTITGGTAEALVAWSAAVVDASNLTVVGPGAAEALSVGKDAALIANNATITGYPAAIGTATGGSVALRSSVVWGNDDILASVHDGGISLQSDVLQGGCPIEPGVSCSAGLGSDPLLQLPAALHGGYVSTIPLGPDSSAIDTGLGAPFCPAEDARHVDRPYDGDGNGTATCDRGSFEYVIPPTVTFSETGASIPENGPGVFLSFSVSHDFPEPLSFEFVSNGGTAIRGVDYLMPQNPTVYTRKPGQFVAVAALTLVNDALDEDAETALFKLQNPTNAVIGAQDTFTATITDDDAPPTVSFAAAASSGSESTAKAKIPVKLSGPSGKAVKVGYAVTGGTATNGTDYQPVTLAITISAGQTGASLVLPVLNDWTPEPDETVAFKLATPVNATIGAADTHSYTIKNDDKVRFCQGKKVTIYGTPGKDRLSGTPRLDVIDAMGGDDLVRSRGGNDIVCGGAGKDVLRGGPGNDTLNGGAAADELFGAGGDDTLLGKAGADTLRGELGGDRLAGGSGKPDVCDGGPSTDVLLPAHGCESVVGVP